MTLTGFGRRAVMGKISVTGEPSRRAVFKGPPAGPLARVRMRDQKPVHGGVRKLLAGMIALAEVIGGADLHHAVFLVAAIARPSFWLSC
jgi:hypothetical protein